MAVATIDNKSGGGTTPTGPTLIGTYSGNKTVDVSAYIKSGDTADNFIVEMYSCGSSSTSSFTGDKNQTYYGGIIGFSLTKTLSGTNLVVSGAQAKGYVDGSNINRRYTTENISWRLYHV